MFKMVSVAVWVVAMVLLGFQDGCRGILGHCKGAGISSGC